jgi:PAS domain S-box-containing protein
MHDAWRRSSPAEPISTAAPDAPPIPRLINSGVSAPVRRTLPTIGSAAAAVLAASPNAIVAVNAAGRISYANSQVEPTFGYKPADLIGRSLAVLLPHYVRVRHRAHVKAYFGHLEARPIGIGLDLAGRHRDGREFPVEIGLAPVETDMGLQVFATIVDISARKAAVAALAESERRFRAVLEASPNAVLSIDESGLIMYVNPTVQKTFGYPPHELIGESIDIVLPQGLDGRHGAQIEWFLHERVARPIGIGIELVGRHSSGREFPVEIGTSPVETEGGLQIFATIVDITARKVAEGELLQAQKLESVGRLAGGIAHDFNNILFAITGYSELLEEDLAGGEVGGVQETALQSVKAIGEAARRGASLTSQLLSFSRQQVVSAQILDIDAAVAKVEPMLQQLIGARIDLILRLESDGARVKVDPGQFDQIIVNLVVNARDAMPDGGMITIETEKVELDDQFNASTVGGHEDVAAGHYAMVSVSDNGIGMDDKTLQHAFEPFYTTKAAGKGTGLGLATSYGIVRQAGGAIWLYSEPGLGSVFKVHLPIATGSAVEAVPHAQAPTPSSPGGTALIVEDEPAVRDVTTRLLRRAGYRVVAVADSAEALRAADELDEPVDVLVTDAVMPGMSGVELADRVHERYPSAAVVILSGYTAETLDLERVIAQGARFVSKPIASGALLDAVGAAIADRKQNNNPR